MSGIGTLRLIGDVARVGAGLCVRFTLDAGHLECEWTPRKPTRREFKRVQARYRSARDDFMRGIAARIGGTLAVVELE